MNRTSLAFVGGAALITLLVVGSVLSGTPLADGDTSGDAEPMDDGSQPGADVADDGATDEESDDDEQGADETTDGDDDPPADERADTDAEQGDGMDADEGEEDDESASVAFDGEEPIELDPADPTISGTADLDPGTDLEMQVMTLPGSENPFFTPVTTTVDDDGSFEIEIGIHPVDLVPGTEAEAVARIDGNSETLGRANVTIVEPSEKIPEKEEALTSDLVSFEGEAPLELVAGHNVVNGTAENLTAGATLPISVRGVMVDDHDPFPVEDTPTVDETGTFTAELDLSEVEPGTELLLFVVHPDATEADPVEGVVIEPDANGTDAGTGQSDGNEADDQSDATASDGQSGPAADDGQSAAGDRGTVEFDGEEPLELDPANATVSGTASVENGTDLVVRVNTSDVRTGSIATADADGEFAAGFEFRPLVPEPGTEGTVSVNTLERYKEGRAPLATAPVRIVEPSENLTEARVEFDGEEPLELDPDDPTVSGTVDVESGAELTFYLVTVPGSDTPFFEVEKTSPGPDGAFEVTFDLDDVPPGTEAELYASTVDRIGPVERVDVVVAESDG